ncbi:phosphoenolpyruvate synthase [Nocardiopsis sp. RSe5-2]|uniref:Phosphoenolpyruvate synthase n=1 Tax=Nocardiopsis endophytica TaxID=3018445 RepID=A0ABT4U0Q6_9ACTN|nr:rifamycin-inactivating phosphotransferase [Nocardiopsis endophytica]MDA2810511.1 phosphoenolpyruvate synthase [Nocardiopsis endophytica]
MPDIEGGAAGDVAVGRYVVDLRATDRRKGALVGGKGANLGELSGIEGIDVPDGFCVTTEAFRRAMAEVPSLDDGLARLSRLDTGDTAGIRALSAEVRAAVEEAAVPNDLAAEILRALARHGEDAAYAVRSSATAEDLPGASFAGQQDTYLNIVGPTAVVDAVRRCWASLFTERAVAYRQRNGFGHRGVLMAVVVQRMVPSEAAGVLFTADPVTSNRTVATVEAAFGLGEALVSGAVNADVYRVRGGRVVEKAVGDKRSAVHSAPEGGTRERAVGHEQRERPVLTDEQAVRLVELGRRIERHFGAPQDIEWCLADGGFRIVQSRAITTLFPVPRTREPGDRVYVSVGHQQMMTDAMKPLGISFWQATTPRPMAEAGGRLFVDVTGRLASRAGREEVLGALGGSDPLIGDALRTLLDRGFVPPTPEEDQGEAAGPPAGGAPPAMDADPDAVAAMVERGRASLAAAEREIRTVSGPELFDFILKDLDDLKGFMFDPQGLRMIMAGIDAAGWLNERLHAWLGETNPADTLTRSAPGNVASEMGLALLDVADAVRPHPEVVAFLREVGEDQDFLEEMDGLAGGAEARSAIRGYLDTYGMRCVGEIDITRPRWSERPAALVPAILGNIDNFAAGEGSRRYEEGRQAALKKKHEVLERLRALPEGERRAEEAERMIDRVRTFAGYREYPKYAMVSRYFMYKKALLGEADRLVRDGALGDREDVYFLRFEEFREAVRTGRADEGLIRRRREEYGVHRSLTPPRVLTSEGEALSGEYRRGGAPAGALSGLPVSSGTVEGRARVVLDMAEADLEEGDILVTAFTDPSWSPLFVTAGALVTEVGGLMTHGAVVAREYGLPAVVGVEDATRLIQDGQRIRVDGTAGYVEVLP